MIQSKPVNNPDACLFVALTEDFSPENTSTREWAAWAIIIPTTVIIVFDLIYGFVNNVFDNSQSNEAFFFYNSILSLFFIPLCIVSLFLNTKRNIIVTWLTIFWVVMLSVFTYYVTKTNLVP